MSRFIIDIVLWGEKANEFCLLPLTEFEVLVPADADEKGLSDKGDKAEPLTTTPRFQQICNSRFLLQRHGLINTFT